MSIVMVPWGSTSAFAQEMGFSEAGTRAAYIKTTSGSFRQYEVYAVRPMSIRFDLFDGWQAISQWDISAGYLSHEDIESLVLAAGPVVVFRKSDIPWYVEVGSRPTLISEHEFDQKDFGGPFQFTSHGTVGWSRGDFEIAYRIQHMSNARIYSDNDGLNLHVLEIGWAFGRGPLLSRR